MLSELSLALDEAQHENVSANQPEESADDNVGGQSQTAASTIAAITAAGARTAGDPEKKKARKIDSTADEESDVKKAPAKKKKKKKGNHGSTVIAIVLGILIALLLVAGAALFMLSRMGFFELLSDDELLQTQSTATEETLENIPSANPEIPEQPPVESVVEPVEESIVEDSVLEEPPVEDETGEGEVIVPEISVDEPAEESDVNVDKFTLTGADSYTFNYRGETVQIVYVVAPEEAEWDIVWESSDETVASVNSIGVITARRGGNCTITGTCGDLDVSVQVICNFSVPETVLDMNYSDITMDHEGQQVQMKIDYELTDEQIDAIVWESSDPAVATVDEEGIVTAVADGTVVISASIEDYTASCIVRCVNVTGNKGVNPEDSEYVINYEDVTLARKGEYFQLSLKSILDNEVPAYEWESSDSSIATVDSKGIVTAVADGTCKITTTIGEDKFECIVRVRITG